MGGAGRKRASTALNQLCGGLACKRLRIPALEYAHLLTKPYDFVFMFQHLEVLKKKRHLKAQSSYSYLWEGGRFFLSY